ncbi:MAG: hypothetical protein SPE37_00930 [Campylobacter sp.]|nr:hypothetical protein [Campylobacter sp.]
MKEKIKKITPTTATHETAPSHTKNLTKFLEFPAPNLTKLEFQN